MRTRPRSTGLSLPHPRVALLAAILVALAACQEDANSPTGVEAVAPPVANATAALSFRQVSAGWQHTCGVTTTNVAYCWGANHYGQLGDGTETWSPRPVKVAGGLRFLEVRAGDTHTCGVTTDSLATAGATASGAISAMGRPAPTG